MLGEVVVAEDYDAAQSELAALREELAQLRRWEQTIRENSPLVQRLTAAEQRNAELVELLRDAACAVKDHAMTAWAVPLYIRINNALAQPTESGASE
jgi:hypothetical protein